MEYTILLIVEVLSALGLVGLVLLQQGNGADVGASFGAGASQTIFGSSGSGNFMTRMTGVLATVFFVTCLGLGYFATQRSQGKLDVLDFSTPAEQAVSGDLPPISADATSEQSSRTPASSTDAVPSSDESMSSESMQPESTTPGSIKPESTKPESTRAASDDALPPPDQRVESEEVDSGADKELNTPASELDVDTAHEPETSEAP
ncbi:MAG: preprotein translocase subunit SecG [Gammaproteobacteria bacterium]